MQPLRRILLVLAVALPAAASAQPSGFAVNSDDRDEADRLLSIDLPSGTTTLVGELPSLLEDVEGLAFAPDGQLYGADSATRTLVRVNLETGGAQSVDGRTGNLGFAPGGSLDFGLTFTCDGRLLLAAEQTRSLYEVDRDTGAARLVGALGGLGDAMTAVASFGPDVYGLAAGGGFYRIDAEAGTAEWLATIDAFEITDGGLAFDDEGTLWAVASDFSFDPSRIFTIDPASGAVTERSRTRPGVESLAIGPPAPCSTPDGTVTEPVPVPALGPPGLLLLLGAFLLGGWSALRRERAGGR